MIRTDESGYPCDGLEHPLIKCWLPTFNVFHFGNSTGLKILVSATGIYERMLQTIARIHNGLCRSYVIHESLGANRVSTSCGFSMTRTVDLLKELEPDLGYSTVFLWLTLHHKPFFLFLVPFPISFDGS